MNKTEIKNKFKKVYHEWLYAVMSGKDIEKEKLAKLRFEWELYQPMLGNAFFKMKRDVYDEVSSKVEKESGEKPLKPKEA